MSAFPGVFRVSLAAALAAVSVIAVSPALAWKGEKCEVRYRVTLLPTLGGGDNDGSDIAFDINNRGQVTGRSITAAGETHAFLWTRKNGIEDLGTLDSGVRLSTGWSINERGQVAGTSVTADGGHTFVWTRKYGMRDLGRSTEFQPDINDQVKWSAQILTTVPSYGPRKVVCATWVASGVVRPPPVLTRAERPVGFRLLVASTCTLLMPSFGRGSEGCRISALSPMIKQVLPRISTIRVRL